MFSMYIISHITSSVQPVIYFAGRLKAFLHLCGPGLRRWKGEGGEEGLTVVLNIGMSSL